MATMTGMDIDGVRSFAQLLNQKAEEIQQITAAVTGQLNGVQWAGNDATHFRSDWSGTHVAQLHSVMQSLQQAAQQAAQNASQQEQASNS